MSSLIFSREDENRYEALRALNSQGCPLSPKSQHDFQVLKARYDSFISEGLRVLQSEHFQRGGERGAPPRTSPSLPPTGVGMSVSSSPGAVSLLQGHSPEILVLLCLLELYVIVYDVSDPLLALFWACALLVGLWALLWTRGMSHVIGSEARRLMRRGVPVVTVSVALYSLFQALRVHKAMPYVLSTMGAFLLNGLLVAM